MTEKRFTEVANRSIASASLSRLAQLAAAVAIVLTVACGDDSSSQGPWVVQESPVARCGAGNTDFENARWEHDSESSRLLLTKAEGCAVYRAEMAFGRTWTTSTEICNRCNEPRYLNWSAPHTADVHGTGLGEGVDINGYKGPDHGDGLSGFVLFTDRNGRQMLNQCQVPMPMVWDAYELYAINGRRILTVQLEPGFVYSSSQEFPKERFVRDYFSNNFPTLDYLRNPVDFGRLDTLHYIWPRFHADATRVVQDFPLANCADLGNGDRWLRSHPEPAWGGRLIRDRGFDDYMLQEFTNELPSDYFDSMVLIATVDRLDIPTEPSRQNR